MQTRILRTVTLMLLTVMITLNSFSQTFDSGDRFFNINVYRVNDDSPQVITVVCKDGPLYVVQMEGGKILNFSVDGRNVPMDSLGRYQAVIDSIKVRVKEAEEQAKRDRAQAERDREQAGRDRQQAERDREQAGQVRQQAERDREQAERDRLQAERNRQQALLDRDQAERNREQADQSRLQAEQNRQQAERDREQASRDRQQAERDREQAERDRVRAEEDRKMMDSLIKDLITDGIVTDRDSIHSLKVDADAVIVNGKRLPEALEKKYISKYVKQGFSMSYHNE
jgi:colicin import membrane protein